MVEKMRKIVTFPGKGHREKTDLLIRMLHMPLVGVKDEKLVWMQRKFLTATIVFQYTFLDIHQFQRLMPFSPEEKPTLPHLPEHGKYLHLMTIWRFGE